MNNIILDTNALINYSDVIETSEKDNRYIVPDIVIREMDKLEHKSRDSELKYQIRRAKHILNKGYDNVEVLLTQSPDNKIHLENVDGEYVDDLLIELMNQMGETEEEKSLLATDDIILKIKAKAHDIKLYDVGEDLSYYSPVIKLKSPRDDVLITKIYENPNKEINLPEAINGQYIEISGEGKTRDAFRFVDGRITKLNTTPLMNEFETNIKPNNTRQCMAFDLLHNNDNAIKVLRGPAGSGKSYLAIHYALERLNNEGKNILYIRNTVDVKGSERLGFLPGELDTKLMPFAEVLSDVIGSKYALEDMLQKEEIELGALNFQRGRQYDDRTIVVDEAQNLSPQHIKMLLTRVGEGTEIIFVGDVYQVDSYQNGNEWLDTLNKFRGQNEYGYVVLDETERSRIAELAEELL